MSYKSFAVDGGDRGIFDSINTFWGFDVRFFSFFAFTFHLVRSVRTYYATK